MDKQFKIDYLQFSTYTRPNWLVSHQDDYKKRSNKAFYTHMTNYANGAVVYEGNANSEKKLVVMSGSVCAKFNMDRQWMQSLVSTRETLVSRIDLCVTVSNNILDLIQKDHRSIQSKLYNKIQIISDADYTPQTIYVGDFANRKKKGIVRAYDKALQLGLGDLSMYRLEVELKQKHAKIASKRLAMGQSIPSIMQSKFKIDRPWFNDIFGDEISTMRFNDTKDDNVSEIVKKMAWIEKQVMPSLKYISDYDKKNGTKNMDRILSQLNINYELG